MTTITALSAATTLAPADVFAIDQSGFTKKITSAVLFGNISTPVVTSADITMTGAARRFVADFNNATLSQRLMFTSAAAGAINFHIIGNGAGSAGGYKIEDGALLTTGNSTIFGWDLIPGSHAQIAVAIRGTGTYLPLTINVGNVERLRIDTAGNIGIGISTPGAKLHVKGNTNQGIGISGEVQLTGAACIAAVNDAYNANIPMELRYGTTVAWFDSGTERMRLSGSNLGIGVVPTASVGLLQVSGTAFATSYFRVGAVGSTAYSGGIENASNTSKSISIEADPTNSGANSLILFKIDNTERMRMTTAGLTTTDYAANNQYSAAMSARKVGASFEFGHQNTAGYGSTLGAHSSGISYLAFACGPGTVTNSYRTYGRAGSVLTDDGTGGFSFRSVTTTTGDSLTSTERVRITGGGEFKVGSGLTGTNIRDYTTGGFGAIYNTNVTPTANNYTLAYNGTSTYVSGATDVHLAVNGVAALSINTGGITANSNTLEMYSATDYCPQIRAVHAGNVQGSAPYSILRRARAGTTAVVNGDYLGTFLFSGYDGSAWDTSAYIFGHVDGTVAAGSVPTAITLCTGATTPTERMRIASDGRIYVAGFATRPYGGQLQVNTSVVCYGLHTAATSAITVGSVDCHITPTWQSLNMYYHGSTESGYLDYCPTVPKALAAELIAVNSNNLVITTNSGPVIIGTNGAEKMRVGATGIVTLGGLVASPVLKLSPSGTPATSNYIELQQRDTGAGPIIWARGALDETVNMEFRTKSTGVVSAFYFIGGSGGGYGLVVSANSNYANFIQTSGSAAGASGLNTGSATVEALGTDTHTHLVLGAKGNGVVGIWNANGQHLTVGGSTAAITRAVNIQGAINTGNPMIGTSAGNLRLFPANGAAGSYVLISANTHTIVPTLATDLGLLIGANVSGGSGEAMLANPFWAAGVSYDFRQNTASGVSHTVFKILPGAGANHIQVWPSSTNPTISTNAGSLAIIPTLALSASVAISHVRSGASYMTLEDSSTPGRGGLIGWSAGGNGLYLDSLAASGWVYIGGNIGGGNAANIAFKTNNAEQVRVTGAASNNQYITLAGDVSNGPRISVGGAANANLYLSAGAGTGSLYLYTNNVGTCGLRVDHVTSANRFVIIAPSNNADPVIGTSAGSLLLQSATGAVVANGGANVALFYGRNNNNLDGAYYGVDSAGIAYAWNANTAVANSTFYVGNGSANNTGALQLVTAAATQVLLPAVVGATRYITLSGSAGGNPTIGASAGCLYFSVGTMQRIAINSAATYTYTDATYTVIQNTAASVHTLPAAASYVGRILKVLMHFAGAVTSASANVTQLDGASTTTAIVSGAGKWAELQSNGSNWQIIAAN
jgi:hypothetical protein